MVSTVSYKEIKPQDWLQIPFIYPAMPQEFSRKIVEIGPGRGDFLFHLAESSPDAQVIGIEIKHKRVDKLIARTEKRELKNIIIIQDDGRKALKRFIKDMAVETIHINFPDPWPKNRHEKNRLISQGFISDCHQALKSDGAIYFTTDFERYAQEVAEEFKEFRGFKSLYLNQISLESDEAYPTFFAQKWIEMGRTIYYQKYVKS
ncbi:MAG: tRNA (guanosine(46)-N7)-methyltransferase TrmB [Pseudomonadota bacterium]